MMNAFYVMVGTTCASVAAVLIAVVVAGLCRTIKKACRDGRH